MAHVSHVENKDIWPGSALTRIQAEAEEEVSLVTEVAWAEVGPEVMNLIRHLVSEVVVALGIRISQVISHRIHLSTRLNLGETQTTTTFKCNLQLPLGVTLTITLRIS